MHGDRYTLIENVMLLCVFNKIVSSICDSCKVSRPHFVIVYYSVPTTG